MPRRVLVQIMSWVLLMLLVGCTPHRVIRTPSGSISANLSDLNTDVEWRGKVEGHSVELFPEFRLGFVEFDDQGAFWDRKQLVEVERMVLADGTEDGTDGVVLVSFVHGWKHDAHVCDENVACFREVLKSLYNLERLSAIHNDVPPRRIVGVYVGWRGRSVTPHVLRETSFFARKSTAHRVGKGEVLELFTRLEMLRDQARSRGGTNSKLIIVGHSFGGAVVFSALSSLFQERLVRAEQGLVSGVVPGFGDLVVLVNPAFEASLYSGIDHVASSQLVYPPEQPAVLLVVSSETDKATTTFFPLGRSLSTLFQRTRSSVQKKSLTTTLGNFEPFLTHRMDKAKTAARGDLLPDIREFGEGRGRGVADCLCSYLQVTVLADEEIEALAGLPGEGTPPNVKTASGGDIFGDVELSPVRPLPPFDPFLVAQASGEIVTEHNGIYNRLFINFLRAFLLEMERRVLIPQEGTP